MKSDPFKYSELETKLLEALIHGTVNDVAHILIYYEERADGRSIGQNVEHWTGLILKRCEVINKRPMRSELQEKLREGIKIRRERLGDALWFSTY